MKRVEVLSALVQTNRAGHVGVWAPKILLDFQLNRCTPTNPRQSPPDPESTLCTVECGDAVASAIEASAEYGPGIVTIEDI